MSNIKYSRDEIVTSSEAVRSFKSLLNDLKLNKKKKIGISRNGKIEAILLSADLLEEFDELFEHLEIYNLLQERKDSKEEIGLDAIKKKYV